MALPHQVAGSRSARWATPRYIVPAVFVLSLALLAGAWRAGWRVNGAELLYDLAVGGGVATALSMVVSVYFRKLERAEEEVRRALEEAEQARAVREAELRRQEQVRWAEIDDRVRGLQQQAQDMEQFVGFTEVQSMLSEQAMALRKLQDDLQWVRARVDPTFRHPTQKLVDEVLRRSDEVERESEVSPSAPFLDPSEPRRWTRLFDRFSLPVVHLRRILRWQV